MCFAKIVVLRLFAGDYIGAYATMCESSMTVVATDRNSVNSLLKKVCHWLSQC